MHQLTDATGYLLAGARPQWLATAAGADMAQRFLRGTIRGRDKAASDFGAVAAYAAARLGLSEAATRALWDTNIRPIALDDVFYQDFCSWAQRAKLTDRLLDFDGFTWPDGLRAADPKLVTAPPAPC